MVFCLKFSVFLPNTTEYFFLIWEKSNFCIWQLVVLLRTTGGQVLAALEDSHLMGSLLFTSWNIFSCMSLSIVCRTTVYQSYYHISVELQHWEGLPELVERLWEERQLSPCSLLRSSWYRPLSMLAFKFDIQTLAIFSWEFQDIELGFPGQTMAEISCNLVTCRSW